MSNSFARKTFVCVFAAVLVVCLVQAVGAMALVKPSVTTTYSDPQLGAHSDLTVGMKFDYGATGVVGNPGDPYPDTYPDEATYPQPSDWRESVKSLVVDTPPGLVGNPNAIPYDERCDIDTFQNGTCPASATVGEFSIDTLLTGADDDPAPAIGDGGLTIGVRPWNKPTPPTASSGYTLVSLLKTTPEVPAKIGILVQPPLGFERIHTTMQIAPDTNSDLKLRTTTLDPITHILRAGPNSSSPPPGTPLINLRIDAMSLKFFGRLPNGHAFMTNPTSCQDWNTTIWANGHFVNNNLDSDPLGSGANEFATGNVATVIPDCTNGPSVPFNIHGTTTISSNARDVSPDFDFTIYNPGVQDDGQAATSPRSVVTRVPASINVDVQQLGRTCTEAQFYSKSCPSSTRVGTVAIETPLIIGGLTGDVFLVTQPGGGLPELGMRIGGPPNIEFTQVGHNKYVGAKGNEIQTTFTDIPQVGFSKLNVHLFGGPNGLLRTLKCPVNNQQPAAGNFTYDFTAYTGATAQSVTKFPIANCFGVQKLRSFKCVYRVLRFQPTYTSRARIKQVVLSVDGRKAATEKRVPFQFNVPAKKFKKGKHKFELRATYDDKTVSKKKSHFTRC